MTSRWMRLRCVVATVAAGLGLLAGTAWSAVEEAGASTMSPRVAALLQAARDSDPLVRHTAIKALSNTRDPAARAALIAMAGDADARIRVLAVGALSKVPNKQGFDGLVDALRDSSKEVSAAAAAGLAALGDKRAVGPLVAGLGGARGRAGTALLQFGDAAVDALAAELRAAATRRDLAAKLLSQIGTKRADAALLAATTDRSWRVRRSVIAHLLQAQPAPKRVVLAAAADSAAPVRLVALGALAQMARKEDKTALNALIKMVNDKDVAVRIAVVQLVTDPQDPGFIKPFSRLLTDPELTVRRGAAALLVKIADISVRGTLVAAAADPDSGVRQHGR